MVRRLSSLAALVALLVFATVALAATPRDGDLQGPEGEGAARVRPAVQGRRSGKRISGLVAHVLETCDGSATSSTTTVGPGLTWTVKNGRFSGRKKEKDGSLTLYTTLEGRFTSPTTAVGTVRQESIIAGSVCDTYKLKFTAKRG